MERTPSDDQVIDTWQTEIHRWNQSVFIFLLCYLLLQLPCQQAVLCLAVKT